MLTREQVEHICKHGVEDGHLFTRIGAAQYLLAHDAALRAKIEELEKQRQLKLNEVEQLQRRVREVEQDHDRLRETLRDVLDASECLDDQ